MIIGENMNKKSLVIILMILAILVSSFANAIIYTQQISSANTNLQSEIPSFIVKTLKYENYPVTSGDWFDIWVQVQNSGQNDAKNVNFEVSKESPFTSSDNLSTDYAIISGAINANKNLQTGEKSAQENQVVLKYRIKVLDNAKDGVSMLKLLISFDGKDGRITQTFELPIVIEKTKTEFAIGLRDSNIRRTTFSIANIGEKSASAVTIQIKDDSSLLEKEKNQIILGSLMPGDLSTFSFPIDLGKDVKEAVFEIAYTDIAGVRNTFEKTVAIPKIQETIKPVVTLSFFEKYQNWIYAACGVVLGLLIGLIFRKKKAE